MSGPFQPPQMFTLEITGNLMALLEVWHQRTPEVSTCPVIALDETEVCVLNSFMGEDIFGIIV